MTRRTKILATLGPATDSVEKIQAIIKAGANVARMNFSHGQADDHIERAKRVREAAKNLGKYVAILGDLQGPKIRVARFKDGSVVLKEGASFILDAEMGKEDGDINAVGIDYKALPDDVDAGDILLLQMEIDLEENWLAVKEAAAKGVRILLNNAPAAPLPAEILPDLSLLIVNEIEVMQATAERGLNADDPLSAARMLHESYGLGLIVTLGGDGSLAITANGSWQVPAPVVEVIDTVGAGDAFTGAFAAALESGRPLPDCLAFASAAGGLACRRHGAQASLALQEEIEALAATLLPRVRAI